MCVCEKGILDCMLLEDRDRCKCKMYVSCLYFGFHAISGIGIKRWEVMIGELLQASINLALKHIHLGIPAEQPTLHYILYSFF